MSMYLTNEKSLHYITTCKTNRNAEMVWTFLGEITKEPSTSNLLNEKYHNSKNIDNTSYLVSKT